MQSLMLFLQSAVFLVLSYSLPLTNDRFLFAGGNVRLVQMDVALMHLGHVISTTSPGAALVFCGDFNSTPPSGGNISQCGT